MNKPSSTTLDVVLLSVAITLLACSDRSSAASSGMGDAATAGAHNTQQAANAGASGQAAGRAGSLAPASAAISGSGGARSAAGSGGAGSGTAGMPAPADAGVRDAGGEPDAQTPACGVCAAYGEPAVTGMVAASELSALSGLAVSRSQPEIIFAHNDHDRPVVYALDLQGKLHARLTLENADATDIEDIAVGKCDTMNCVYLADVGDNAAQRGEYGVLRFAEPTVPNTPGNEQLTPSFERLRFRYEDGSHNAESLLVAPSGNLYIVTKLAPGSGGNVDATGPSSVYRIDASAFAQSSIAEAKKVATLSVPQSGEPALSAAAAHPCGLGFLARTYDRVYEFLVPAGTDFEAAFSATPKVVAMPDEPQSEGIDYRADGRGFVTSGEGSSAPIVLTQCAP